MWPYIVATSFVGACSSAFLCYRLATVPDSPGTDDGSPAVIFLIKGLMVGFVICSSAFGALVGWFISYFVRVLLPLSFETKNG
jgi:hypothetical protein